MYILIRVNILSQFISTEFWIFLHSCGACVCHADSRLCDLERDSGPCTDYRAVWYFEPVRRQCRRFLYGGCHGNANRFSSEVDCRALCLEQSAVTAVTTARTTSKTTSKTTSQTTSQTQSTPEKTSSPQSAWSAVTWTVTWPDDDSHRHQADDAVEDVYGKTSVLWHGSSLSNENYQKLTENYPKFLLFPTSGGVSRLGLELEIDFCEIF